MATKACHGEPHQCGVQEWAQNQMCPVKVLGQKRTGQRAGDARLSAEGSHHRGLLGSRHCPQEQKVLATWRRGPDAGAVGTKAGLLGKSPTGLKPAELPCCGLGLSGAWLQLGPAMSALQLRGIGTMERTARSRAGAGCLHLARGEGWRPGAGQSRTGGGKDKEFERCLGQVQ